MRGFESIHASGGFIGLEKYIRGVLECQNKPSGVSRIWIEAALR